MKDSEKQLFKATLEQVAKIIAFLILALVVVCVVPRGMPRKIQGWWQGIMRQIRESESPFYKFISGRDMEGARKQYDQFK